MKHNIQLTMHDMPVRFRQDILALIDVHKINMKKGANIAINLGEKFELKKVSYPDVNFVSNASKTATKKILQAVLKHNPALQPVPSILIEIPWVALLLEQKDRIPFKKIPLRLNSKRVRRLDTILMKLRLEHGDPKIKRP